jgi:TrkA domain protein
VLAHYGVPHGEIERLVNEIRGSHYEMLRSDAAGRLSLDAVAGVPQMAIERMRLAPQSTLAGKRLATTGLRSQTGALVLSVVRGNEEIATPGPQFRLLAGDVLVVVGQPHQLQAAARLIAGNNAASPQPQNP